MPERSPGYKSTRLQALQDAEEDEQREEEGKARKVSNENAQEEAEEELGCPEGSFPPPLCRTMRRRALSRLGRSWWWLMVRRVRRRSRGPVAVSA